MGFFDKLKKITTNLFSGFTEADEAFFEELEETLILADLGMNTAVEAVEQLRTRVRKEKLRDQEEVKAALRDVLADMIGGGEDAALDLSTQPSIVLFIGVNGVGKTTCCARQIRSAPRLPTSSRSGRSGPDASWCASTREPTPAPCSLTRFRPPRPGTWTWCCATPPAVSTTRQT